MTRPTLKEFASIMEAVVTVKPLPKGAHAPQNLSVELGRCRTALCTAAELSQLLGARYDLRDEVQNALDALRSQLRGLGFSP